MFIWTPTILNCHYASRLEFNAYKEFYFRISNKVNRQ